MDASLRAIVLGGTGAIGECLVKELLASPRFTKVTLISRRQADCFPESDKLNQVIVNMDEMDQHSDSFKDHEVAFNCLGTTRAIAGSAEMFVKVDSGYPIAFAKLCKDAGVRHFHNVSSSGAKSKSWFLYLQSKGKTEDAIFEQNFEKAIMWRPGVLGRGSDKARLVEKMLFFMSIPVDTVAKAMRVYAEKIVDDTSDGTSKVILWNKDIYNLAK